MAVPSSGQLGLYSSIGTELGVSQSNVSLRSMSNSAGFSTPDAMSEFYGYSNALIIQYLVVGAGGGADYNGASYGGGGGGAGGLLYNTSYSLSSGQTLDIIIGAGAANSDGTSTFFGNIEAFGGGEGDGSPGGSGGGGSYPTTPGGAGVAGQGNNGGNRGSYGGGGGGGAGQAGQNFGTSGTYNPGDGGNGLAISITGTSIYYAGGGAGEGSLPYPEYMNRYALPGLGGGGNAFPRNNPINAGVANTGGGAAGYYLYSAYRNGGSGIVILRIPTSGYTGITTGSPTITTVGSDTVLKYTSSGTYTS